MSKWKRGVVLIKGIVKLKAILKKMLMFKEKLPIVAVKLIIQIVI